MYIYTVHQEAYVSIIDGYAQNAMLQNCLLFSGTAVQFGSRPPLCTFSSSPCPGPCTARC